MQSTLGVTFAQFEFHPEYLKSDATVALVARLVREDEFSHAIAAHAARVLSGAAEPQALSPALVNYQPGHAQCNQHAWHLKLQRIVSIPLRGLTAMLSGVGAQQSADPGCVERGHDQQCSVTHSGGCVRVHIMHRSDKHAVHTHRCTNYQPQTCVCAHAHNRTHARTGFGY